MSTLKVNAIEPYSGGTVTITGATVTSASYAETANSLTAGTKTVNGDLNVNGNSILSNTAPGPNPLILASDGSGPKFTISNDDGVPIFGANMVVNGTSALNGNVNLNGTLNTTNGIFLTGSNFVQKDGYPGQSAHIFQNENFFTEYYGTDLKWNAAGGEAQIACGALNKASLTANAFTPDFSTDNLINIQSTLANGTLFDDWAGTWMQVTEGGSPEMKRNLTVNGTNAAPGNTFAVKDGTGTDKLFVTNAALSAITGLDVLVNGTLQVDETITLPNIGNYSNDTDAAAGGVPLRGVYHHNGNLKIRLV